MRGRSMFTFLFACSMGWITTGCSTFSKDEPRADQKLVIDSKIQPMSRNEVIYAVKECESNGLRAAMIYGKRRVNGYTSEIVLDVSCAPKW
jgi:hypothetical protein